MNSADRDKREAIGVSRGGRTTKCHAVCDEQGRLRRFSLTPGNRHDMTAVWDLVYDAALDVKVMLADKGYDSENLRAWLRIEGIKQVIPKRRFKGQKPRKNADIYKQRNLIERAFGRLKDYRRFATRYDKRAHIFEATVALLAIKTWFLI